MDMMKRAEDSAEIAALKVQIDEVWQEQVRLQKELDAADRKNGELRAQLRLLQEGLAVGDTMVLNNGKKKVYGTVETSADFPYLWLREVDASDKPTKRRFKLDNVYYEKVPARVAAQG